ncbi:MAG: hypothetical protein NTV86_19275 [Planctomycetota bacterium]|nr:hypothetical protein [Planctomycetota bacterium]
MTIRNVVIGVAVMIFAQMLLAQATTAPKGPEDARSLAQQLVDDVKHNRGAVSLKLVGREDVLVELPKVTGSLSVREKKAVLREVLSIGLQKNPQRWVRSSAVTAYYVEVAVSADSKEVREYAGDLLVRWVPPSYLAVHAATLIKATKEGKLDNWLLLGKTGEKEAKVLIPKGGNSPPKYHDSARAAAARLGDAAESKAFVEAYQREKDDREKAYMAKALGYIGDAACVLALARDMRTPVIYDSGPGLTSLRLDIIAALGEAFPDEPVFANRDVRTDKDIDAWYDAVEKWLEGHLGVTWQTERPKPFAFNPRPTPVPQDTK